MAWENSIKGERATSFQLQPTIWLVRWKGGDYIVQGQSPWWHIRRRGSPGILQTIMEKEGLGKEEAVAWIENNI